MSPAAINLPWRAGLAICLAASALLFGGCASAVYQVDVDALKNPAAAPPGFAYEIVPMNPSIPVGSAQFAQARKLVRKSLTTVGMYEAGPGEPVDVIVGIDFGVGMRQAAGVTQTSITTISGRAGMVTNVPGIGVSSGRTATPVGPTPYHFRKYLSIVASVGGAPGLTGGPRTELWRVDVSLVDKGDNMEHYLPILAGVASQYVATSTQEKTTLRVSANDEIVHWVQQDF